MVIGSGSGIGRESALALGAHGAAVVCADRDGAAAADTAAMIGNSASAITLDVLDHDAVAATAQQFGDIAALVFTAATNVRKRIADYTMDEFDRVVNLNLRASFSVIQSFAPAMAANGGGSIIGFASIRAVTVEPGQGAYAATKAGLVQLLRTAAAEYGQHGVRVNAISPGVVETPLTAQIKNQRRMVRRIREQERVGPLVPARGVGRRRRLPGLRRLQLCHRLRAHGRRRLDCRRWPLRSTRCVDSHARPPQGRVRIAAAKAAPSRMTAVDLHQLREIDRGRCCTSCAPR